tara:strand:+ start:307 stop:759 length:453 start_codon:yes stop_codon:yes gene_type:complete
MYRLLGIVILLLAVNCKSTENKAKMVEENVILIGEGNLYGSGSEGIEQQNLVITSESEWKELLTKMDSVNKVSDSFSQTEIDFSKYSIIAVFDAVKNSGGHSLELDINETKNKVLVKVKRKSPEGMATMVMTQPYYIVKIPESETPIVFE